VALPRLVLRPDARLAAGALGVAAAIALPLVATLVLSGLQPVEGEGGGAVAYAPDGGILRLPDGLEPRLAVAQAEREGRTWVAYVTGPPVVQPGHARAPPGHSGPLRLGQANLTIDAGTTELPLVPPGAVLVHPSQLAGAPMVAALLDRPASVPGATVVPARGAQAFEEQTTAGIRTAGLAAVAGSVPVAALVVATFARLEMRERRHQAAVLAALGGARQARWVLWGRIALVVALGAATAAVLAALAWRLGGPSFRPDPLPIARLAVAAAVPSLGGLLAGLAATWGFQRELHATLRRGPREPAPAQVRWPLSLRPLVTGFGLVPALLLSATLFVVDVGFPLAASGVPAQVAGGPGEWVSGSAFGIRPGVGVPEAPAVAARLDPRVERVLAETVAPTLLGGVPVVVRGGSWGELAGYHGLELIGAEPGPGIVLGERLARRQGWEAGDRLVLQGAHRPFVHLVQVRGIASAEGLPADEAFVGPELGRSLAGLPEGQVSFVRVRPDTLDAREALARRTADIQATSLRLEPPEPVAGTLAQVVVEAVNAGGAAGSRTFTLRVDGAGVESRPLRLEAFARGEVAIPFIVPEGPYTIEVNPTLPGEAAPAGFRLEGPAASPPDRPLIVRLRGAAGEVVPGVAVTLHATLEAAQANRTEQRATTDSNGAAVFRAPGHDVVARAWTQPPVFLRVPAERGAGLLVEQAWAQPASAPAGTPIQVLATVRNPGAAAANASLHVRVDGLVVQVGTVAVPAQEARTVAFPVLAPAPGDRIEVGGRSFAYGTSPASGGEPPRDAGVRRGEALQAQLADRLLGNARLALAALAALATATSLAVVLLGTQRVLHARRHVFGVLHALGHSVDSMRARAATEAGLLAGAAMAAALLPAKALFWAAGRWGPTVFGHAVPDPIGALFAFQCVAAFAGVGALAAYGVAGRVARTL
jgi:cell division protein FtsX